MFTPKLSHRLSLRDVCAPLNNSMSKILLMVNASYTRCLSNERNTQSIQCFGRHASRRHQAIGFLELA